MKRLYNTSLSLIIAITVISCSKQEKEVDEVAYYKFTAEDVNQIPEFTLNQKIVYKNQFGETINFTVTSLSKDKVLYTVGMGFLSPYAASYFYYDRKQIILSPDNDNAYPLLPLSYDFWRWPDDLDSAKANYKTLLESSLIGRIALFEKFDNSRWIYYNEYCIIITLEINGIEFNNVKVFESTNQNGNTDDSNLNIKTIYYTDKNGVIGFDETSGTIWRKQ